MTVPFPPRRLFTIPLPHRDPLHLGGRCLVMGVVNVTPDSFADERTLRDPDAAAAHALALESEGADLVDIGGESTRPGAGPVGEADELARVTPVLRRLAGRLRVPLSIDTSKAAVARAALDFGAAIVNDVTGLQRDPAVGEAAAAAGAALILMHSRGTPASMGSLASYTDLAGEIVGELRAAIDRAVASGVSRGSILIDPGIGFAKRRHHSYGVLARLGAIAAALDRPLVAGPSRKSFMREETGDDARARDWGTAAAVTAAVLAGAHVVRVHDVRAMTQVVKVAEEIRRHG
ncbi:MAG TPA: dihydropteroate synthase [Vicinamibacterales bacterium]|jgi:dihydropteroate synthase|nr:dihydropteroate synthase [Vicinamibacterales bacterium]